MGFHSCIVAAGFHTRVDAIEATKQVIAEVTAPSLDEEGCQIYHWSQGADDPTLFLLYMEWRDKACFERHMKHAEDRLNREKILIESAKEWHFHRLIDGHRAVATKKSRVTFTACQTARMA